MKRKKHDGVELCYVLLCHKQPEEIIAQIEYLLEAGGKVVYHMDKGSPSEWHREIKDHFVNEPKVVTVPSIKAGWGDWSLVKATLRMLKLALKTFPEVTHFYYLSGDCYPIRPVTDLEYTLSEKSKDYIETAEFYNGGWIKTGPHLERINFFHFVNERKYKWLFYRLYDIQRLFGVKREVPAELKMSIGSQWWCLRRKTIEKILDFLQFRSDIAQFFKYTWIPDEIFFQTMVATLIPAEERTSTTPTFLRFSDYGLPTVFYDDHYDFLIQQDRFFARKVSPNSVRLRKRLVRNFLDRSNEPGLVQLSKPEHDKGVNTIGFVVHAGRNGFRFGSKIWDKFSKIGADQRIYVFVSKKWHVGHRFGHALSNVVKAPYFGYVFDEVGSELENMGGLEKSVAKRRQQPAAFLSTVLKISSLNELIIGIDPSRADVLKLLQEHCVDLRVLEIENEFDAEYLEGHAERMGLQSAKGASMQKVAMQNTLLESLHSEANKLKSIGLKHHEFIRSWHSARQRSEVLVKLFERDFEEFIKIARHLETRD